MEPVTHDPTVADARGRRARPTRRARGIGAAVAGVVAVGALGLVLVTRDGSGSRNQRLVSAPTPSSTVDVPTTSVATTTPGAAPTTKPAPVATAPPTTARREVLSADSRLRLDGIGPVDIGMTLEQASAAAGLRITAEKSEFYGPECSYARPQGDLEGELLFMVTDGKIARIDTTYQGKGRIRTLSGIGKGSTEADVKRAYPGRIRVEGHPYLETGHYLVYTAADPALAHLSLIFETDGNVVTSVPVGPGQAGVLHRGLPVIEVSPRSQRASGL